MSPPLRGLLFAFGITVTVLGLPFAFESRYTLGLWILLGVVPALGSLTISRDDDRRWRQWEGED